MRATRLPRLHVITDTRGPIAKPVGPLHDPAIRHAVASQPTAGTILEASQALGSATPQRGLPAPTGPGHGADRGLAAAHRDPLLAIEAALAAGARLVQVRPEDHYTDRAAFDLATAIAALCDQYGAVCLVNDRVHLAQAVGADGVHLGADDLPIDAARRILPAAAIIGGTARDAESARAARRAGATYLGVGPVWGTTTKAGLPQPIGLDGLAAVCEAVDLPVIAIGGITAERAALCRQAGAHGVAVVGAIAAAADPHHATAALLEAVGESPAVGNSGGIRAPRTASDSRGERFGAAGVRHTVHENPAAGGERVPKGSADLDAQPADGDAGLERLGRSEPPGSGLRSAGEAPVLGSRNASEAAGLDTNESPDTGLLRGVGEA